MNEFSWDPAQYSKFSDHRARPFRDLTSVIDVENPRTVIDLGSGPGTMTRTLAQRWPNAKVVGLDSSHEMVQAAQKMLDNDPHAPQNLSFEVANASEWMPDDDVDVMVSNAMLQWIPRHRKLMEDWVRALNPGAWFAAQVPGNFAAPSHATIFSLAQRPEFARASQGVYGRESIYTPTEYTQTLLEAGMRPMVWETTYHQALLGDEPVYSWVKGAALRPVLQALRASDAAHGTQLHDQYVEEYRQAMREAYPPYHAPDGAQVTVFPMRRVFVVGHKVLDFQI